MTPPVDIAAAVELARTYARYEFRTEAEDTLSRALIALADERRDIEQRTAEAIAEMLLAKARAVAVGNPITDARIDGLSAAVDLIRAGKWRTP